MKIKYKPLCQGATAIPADAVLKDYGDVKEVCSECGVPVKETCNKPKTIEEVFTFGFEDPTFIDDLHTLIGKAKVARAKAQLESIMQDYAIEARIAAHTGYKKTLVSAIETYPTDNDWGKGRKQGIQDCINDQDEYLLELEQLRTTNQTLEGEDR